MKRLEHTLLCSLSHPFLLSVTDNYSIASTLKPIAEGDGEDPDLEGDANLTVFDKAEGDDEDGDEEEKDDDEEMAGDKDEDGDEEDEDEEAEGDVEMDGEDMEGESTTFDYDLVGIKERLFAVGSDKETVEQNRRKVYVLYKAYQDFCPPEEDGSEGEEEGEDEDE